MMRLLPDRRGVALIEFALLLPLLLVLTAIVVDLGFCYNARLNTLRGVTAGALYAFENGGTVTAATAPQLRTAIAGIVTDGAGSAMPTVAILINNDAGTATAGDYYCPAGQPVVWRSVGSASIACGDGTMAAKYVTIRTSGDYPSLIPFAGLGRRLFPLTETIVVRAK